MLPRMWMHSFLPASPTPPLAPTLGTMLLQSLHLICFCGRPASCAHHLVLEMKAKDMETLSLLGWLRRWVLPEGRIYPCFLRESQSLSACLQLTWE